MPTIVAIFDHMDSLTEAREALEQAGFGDDVERVIDQSHAGGERSTPVAASPRAGGFVVNRAGRTAPTDTYNAPGDRDLNLDLPEDEEAFVMESIGDGARVMVIDTDNPTEVAEILEPKAERVITGK